MKKTYIQPYCEAVAMKAPAVLFSGSTANGDLGEFVPGTQLAPELPPFFDMNMPGFNME